MLFLAFSKIIFNGGFFQNTAVWVSLFNCPKVFSLVFSIFNFSRFVKGKLAYKEVFCFIFLKVLKALSKQMVTVWLFWSQPDGAQMGGCMPSLHTENSLPLKMNLLAVVLSDWQVSSLPTTSALHLRIWSGERRCIPSLTGRFLQTAVKIAFPIVVRWAWGADGSSHLLCGEEMICFLGMLLKKKKKKILLMLY